MDSSAVVARAELLRAGCVAALRVPVVRLAVERDAADVRLRLREVVVVDFFFVVSAMLAFQPLSLD